MRGGAQGELTTDSSLRYTAVNLEDMLKLTKDQGEVIAMTSNSCLLARNSVEHEDKMFGPPLDKQMRNLTII